MGINNNLNKMIVAAINAGICADVADRMHDDDHFTADYVHSNTDGYNLEKTIKFIEEKIHDFNRASKYHSHQK